MRLRAAGLLLAVAVLTPAFDAPLRAQAAKKVLTQDTYDLWRSIAQPTLSADGAWAVYTLSPVLGDGELVARATSGATEYRAPRGWTGRPMTSVSGAPFNAAAARITGDGRHVVFLRYPAQASMDSARARRARPADLPKNALGIMSLADGRVTEIPRVRGFEVARDGGRYVVYQVDADTTAAANGRGARGAGAATPAADSSRPAPRRKDAGTPLVIRELATGTEVRIEGVSNYVIDDAERWLVYSLTGPDSAAVDGVYARELATGSVSTLKKGTGNYRSLALDEAGTQVAFVSDADQWTDSVPRFSLHHSVLSRNGRSGPQGAAVAVAADAVGDGLRIAERGGVSFVRSGGVLRFNVQPLPADSIPADSLADKAVVDLWHWRDTRLQTMQRVQAGQDRNRAYAAVWHVASRQMRRVANDTMPNAQLSDDGRTAVLVTNSAYQLDAIAGEGGNDVYVMNTVTGDIRKVATRIRGSGQLSPDARYVAWWEERNWQVHDIAANRTRNLTGTIHNFSFERETHDTPSEPTPWGVGGWTRGDARVLVYDRYDIWELDPAGRAEPRNLTEGEGRKANLTFRLVDLDADERFYDPAKPLLLRAFDNATKHAGFYRDRTGANTPPERLLMAPKSWPVLQKARRAEQYLVARADYREYPDLWVGPSFDRLTKLTDAMPEQSQYLWGDVELVKWLNSDGVEMEGLLYKPEGFDPSRQYPMVVYFYEQLSDGLHNYVRPAGRNVVNAPVYTSLGYLVFMPNIHYTPGYPGPSSVKSIVPGVQALVAKGFVHPKKVGIAGQSWGGYQSAYIITQTNLFAAAVPNATVVNMTSAYGGIRWESGVERAIVNYERGQSRIGGSLWEYPERYIENSPLFYLDRVQTPVLFMANDNDGAVPWYQGIEFFVAMRRLGKEAYMVNYNGDAHNPRKYANQKDIDRRMQEFFATKLLGAPAPDWMKKGIPFLDKGRDQFVAPVAEEVNGVKVASPGSP
jgi:dipeptidyl aminopeptidase/acylaminoacyl peptidase